MEKDKAFDPYAEEEETTGEDPVIASGIGMTVAEVQEQIVKTFKGYVADDDPLMLMVPIMNAFLFQIDELYLKHNKAVTKIMASQSAKYIGDVKKSAASLSDLLKESSLTAIRDLFFSHSAAIDSNKRNSRWCAAIIGASALINVIVYILMGRA